MKFGSLFTGVGGFDLGFERAGMKCEWQVEFDKNCQNILRKHWSETELFDDVRTVGKHNLKPVDLICGGFPCQDVSIAGKRAGIAGERSGLWFEFARIIDELEPAWVVIENVAGLLSSHKGRDFAVIIRWLAERGYGVAWRVLDSQYFGVAQRRRRVFIVGSFGNGRAAEVLFESESVSGDTQSGKETGQTAAGTIESGSVLGFDLAQITSKLNYSNPKIGDPQPPLNTLAQGYIAQHVWQFKGQDCSYRPQDKTGPTVTSTWGTGGNNMPIVVIRRLTPTECERLQGFPDVTKSAIISVCTDHRKTSASAGSQNPRLPKRVGTAGKRDLLETVKSAESSLSTSDPQTSEPAAVHVHIDLERQVLLVHSHEKLLLSVNIAERKSSSPLRIPAEDFARLVALTLTTRGKTTHNGKAVSRQNTMPSTAQPSGNNVVRLYGEEIGALAADAEEFTKMVNLCLTYTTSEAAQSFLNLEQISTISSYCVVTAIASFIPELTNPTSSYNLKLSTSGGWTDGQAADSHRYKQMGNAVTVNVAEWIAKRIAEVNK